MALRITDLVRGEASEKSLASSRPFQSFQFFAVDAVLFTNVLVRVERRGALVLQLLVLAAAHGTAIRVTATVTDGS